MHFWIIFWDLLLVCVHPIRHNSPFLISALFRGGAAACTAHGSPNCEGGYPRHSLPGGIGAGAGAGVDPARNWTGSGHQHRQGGGPRVRCALGNYPRGETPFMESQQDVTNAACPIYSVRRWVTLLLVISAASSLKPSRCASKELCSTTVLVRLCWKAHIFILK